MGQILTNEELKENMKKVHYLYGDTKDAVYSVQYVEEGNVTYNGINYPLEKSYMLYKSFDEGYSRVERLDKDSLFNNGIIKYNVHEILEDPIGLAIFHSEVSGDWYYYYRDSEEYCSDKSIVSNDFHEARIYNYYLDGQMFKSYNDMICYDTINDKLYLNYGRTYELDSHQDIYNQISNNTINMPEELNSKLVSNMAGIETVCSIMSYYRIYCKFQKDLPEIKDEINKLNNLSLEEVKEEIVSEVKETVVKRKLTRKQKKKNKKMQLK